jgi:glycosyltransferase involved in cell wall biosynthesis
MLGVSVVICCYNSVDRIKSTLIHLKQQKLNEIPWEVILVNNNSTDNTENEAIDVWDNSIAQLIIVREIRSGLIYARECGINYCRYDYIVFCDDDNWLDENYLRIVYELFQKLPNVGALGGCSTVALEADCVLPDWFFRNENAYAVGAQSAKSGDITMRLFIWGAGMAIRKNIAQKCFDQEFPFLLTGRNGNKITAGDDAEICKRIIIMGFRLFYDERLKFQHFITPSRLTEGYFLKMNSGFEASYSLLGLYSEFISVAIFNQKPRLIVLLQIIRLHGFRLKKFMRLLYWLFGVHTNVNGDMRTIRGFYKKYSILQ